VSLTSSSAKQKHGPIVPLTPGFSSRRAHDTHEHLARRGRCANVMREGCPMAVTAPNDIQTPRLITGEVHSSEIVVHRDDLKGVRLYFRLAAAIRALAVVLLALFVIWISIRLFGGQWNSRQTLVPLTVVLVAAALFYLLAELRLRSYRLDLTADAVIFEYGRKRSYVPREHIQLFDVESSILLRIFRLRRCNLHTGGGMVVVSPVPARIASAIERLIHVQPATLRGDRTDANS
jgi:membrane protein YdbS with pleckstrin-like domain